MSTIVIVTGGFDPLHSGHIAYLNAARLLGDKLCVGLNSDAWLIRKKGYDGIRYNGGENMNMATRHNVYMPYNADSIKTHKITQLVTKKK